MFFQWTYEFLRNYGNKELLDSSSPETNIQLTHP